MVSLFKKHEIHMKDPLDFPCHGGEFLGPDPFLALDIPATDEFWAFVA